MFYEMFVDMNHILCSVEVTMVKQRTIAVSSTEPTTSNSDPLFEIMSVAEYEASFRFHILLEQGTFSKECPTVGLCNGTLSIEETHREQTWSARVLCDVQY